MPKLPVLMRSFNPYIFSKTGEMISVEKERDGTYWRLFEKIIKRAFFELGYDVIEQLENPLVEDLAIPLSFKVIVHKNKSQLELADFFYMQMHMKNLFTFDHIGWGAENSKLLSEPNLDEVNSEDSTVFSRSIRRGLIESGSSKHVQPTKLNVVEKILIKKFKLPRKYILVPLQTPRDYVIEKHSDLEVKEFIEIVADWSRRNKYHVVIKLHPHNRKDEEIKSKVEEEVSSSEFISLVDGNINDLITMSQAVWVINSGVGFESLIHHKPVITMGDCDYKWFTLNRPNVSGDQIKDWIQSNHSWDRIDRFIYFYFKQVAFEVKEENYKENVKRVKNYLLKKLEDMRRRES